ncbi:hypothetical protein [Streptomyces sp. NPDC056891]
MGEAYQALSAGSFWESEHHIAPDPALRAAWTRERHNVFHWLRTTDHQPYYGALKPLLEVTPSTWPTRSTTVSDGMHNAPMSHDYRPGDVLLLECPFTEAAVTGVTGYYVSVRWPWLEVDPQAENIR